MQRSITVNISHTINTGVYESVKIEFGITRDLAEDEDEDQVKDDYTINFLKDLKDYSEQVKSKFKNYKEG